MKRMRQYVTSLVILLLAIVGGGGKRCGAQLMAGQTAPHFAIEDLQGKGYDLAKFTDKPMIILYFFDIESRPSQEGLLSLDDLAKRYKGTALSVWAITRSSENKVTDFVLKSALSFPVFLDNSKVSSLYNAQLILPTIYTLGPGLTILDVFQGGGRSTEVMLTRLAERNLQQRKTELAKAISDKVIKKNPKSVKARVVKGYAHLKEGKLKEAEKVFKEVTKKSKEGEVLGKEGLTATYAKSGKVEEALTLAKDLEKEAPDRAYAHVVKGDILYSQGKKEEAKEAYEKAIDKKKSEVYQQGVGYNQLGRLYANEGNYENAQRLYDKAVNIDPYYIEATTNKGIAFEKEGKWDDALKSYHKALSLEKDDTFAVTLAKRAEEILAIQKDAARKERVDKLVKELAERYRTQKTEVRAEDKDEWTSRPMILSFIDFQETGGLSQRDGFSLILITELANHLNSSGRLRIVERYLMERLLEELNLGSSDLADPETALKLGRVLAAKLIGTGSLYHLPNETLLSLRLIDSETSAIVKVITRKLSSGASLQKALRELNREILTDIISHYPLRGYIVQVEGDEAIINLGSKQGVVLGTKFEVLEEKEPIKFKGKILKTAPTPIGHIEISKVEPDLCYARIIEQRRELKTEDKISEQIEEAVLGGRVGN
ncbi:MAG: tetratricopeptide repeat protein [bacterium]